MKKRGLFGCKHNVSLCHAALPAGPRLIRGQLYVPQ